MYISSKALTAAAALSAGVAADFLVITDYPDALKTLSPEQAQSWINEQIPGLRSEFLQLATDTSYIAAATSVIPELNQFVATASVSIPSVVTALDDIEIYTTVPPWYTQLPSGVRSFYDDVAERVESYLEQNVPSNVTASPTPTPNASASESESPTRKTSVATITSVGGPTPSGPGGEEAPPEETGRAGKVEVGMGMGVVAGVVGVLMM